MEACSLRLPTADQPKQNYKHPLLISQPKLTTYYYYIATMKTKTLIALAVLSTSLFAAPSILACGDAGCAGGGKTVSAKDAKNVKVWTCSMHPEIKKDKPGKCPICGMALIPAKTPAKKK